MTDKISLSSAGSGYNLATINENFSKIEEALNERVQYRDVLEGETNSVLSDMDVNGKRLYNLPEPIDLDEAARLRDVQAAIAGATAANLITASDGAGGTLWTTVQGFITRIQSSVGAAVMGFLQAGVGATARTVQDKLRDRVDLADFGAVGDGTTDNTAAFTSAIVAAYLLGAKEIHIGVGTFVINNFIELNNQLSTGAYRPVVKVIGRGMEVTKVINRSGDYAFKHTLAQTQGDNNYFSRGLIIENFSLEADGTSPAGSAGISLQGAYFATIRNVKFLNLKGHNIACPIDARFASPDRYSNATVTVQNCILSASTGWGIYAPAFATAFNIINCYTAVNSIGGYYLTGSHHYIQGGAVTGCGVSNTVDSGGINFAYSSLGNAQGNYVISVEIDSNYRTQAYINGSTTRFVHCRFVDDATSGAFRSSTQVTIGTSAVGSQVDSNTIDSCEYRLTNQGAANVVLCQVNLSSTTGNMTARYNQLKNPRITISGTTSGVTTTFAVQNSTSVWAEGCKYTLNGSVQFSSSTKYSTSRSVAAASLAANFAIPVSPAAAGVLTANSIIYDTHSAYNNVAYEYTAPYTGLLRMRLNLLVASGAANTQITVWYQKNTGGGYSTQAPIVVIRDGNAGTITGHFDTTANAGDKFRIIAQQVAGGTAVFATSSGSSVISYEML